MHQGKEAQGETFNRALAMVYICSDLVGLFIGSIRFHGVIQMLLDRVSLLVYNSKAKAGNLEKSEHGSTK